MSTFISEPGTRLGGRYRLEDRISASGGWSAWKAIDETLARPVTVLTFAPGFPRIREVVTAARAASRLTDARLAQVFDVEENWDQAYVVMEWVARAAAGAPVSRRPALQPAPGPGRGAVSRRRHHLPGAVPGRARRRHRHDVTGGARQRPPPGDPGPCAAARAAHRARLGRDAARPADRPALLAARAPAAGSAARRTPPGR